MTKRLWIDKAGSGFNEDIRQIAFTDADEAERQLLLGSGLRVSIDKLNAKSIRFNKKDRSKVVDFFRQHDIKVS